MDIQTFSLISLAFIGFSLFLYQKFRAKWTEAQLRFENEQKMNVDLTNQLKVHVSKLEEQNKQFVELHSQLSAEKQRSQQFEKQLVGKDYELEEIQSKLEHQRDNVLQINKLYTALKERNEHLTQQIRDQKLQFEEHKQQLKHELEVLSHSILEEKSKKFTEQNALQLKHILEPLGLKIEDFKKQVEQVYTEENKDRATLKEQIKHLTVLNQQMSSDAQNLVKALKGDSKTQGNWGEVILERILEKSGLRKGFEFEVQVTERNEENKLIRPDVIVRLPEEKFMTIDSKVSLTAYEQWVNSENDEEKSLAMKAHLGSIRNHVKGLSEKKYQEIHGNQSPDFVLLFIPIQPAFDIALQFEPDLYQSAFEKNIIIVSPTTLLATLSTVNSVWKQEYQNRHATEIAEKAGSMYDKLVGFTEDLEKVGKSLESTQKIYGDAMKKLSTGNGNLIRRAEHLRDLGIKTTKVLGTQWIESSDL